MKYNLKFLSSFIYFVFLSLTAQTTSQIGQDSSIKLLHKKDQQFFRIEEIGTNRVRFGKQTISKSASFLIEADIPELLEYGFPVPLFETLVYPKSQNSDFKYNHRFVIDDFVRQSYILSVEAGLDPSILMEAWDIANLPENTSFAVAWISKSHDTHWITLHSKNAFYPINEDGNFEQNYHTYKYQANDLFLPVILAFDANAKIIPRKQSSTAILNEILKSLWEGSTNDTLPTPIRWDTDYFGIPLWSLAINWRCYGYIEQWCLDKKFPNTKGPNSTRPLLIASQAGDVKTVRQLIAAGAKTEVRDRSSNTPLLIASHAGHIEVVQDLIKARAKTGAVNKSNNPPMLLALSMSQTPVVAEIYKKTGKLKIGSENEEVFLSKSIENHDLESVKVAVAEGITPSFDFKFLNPIFLAAKKGNSAIIDFLVSEGFDPKQRGESDVTPLHYAATGNLDTVKALVQHGVDIDAQTSTGLTPLHAAIINHQLPVTEYLLEQGANPNAGDENNQSLLWVATKLGDRDTLNELIGAGARCTMTNEIAMPLMDFAFRYDIPEIVEISLNQCLETNFEFSNGFPAYWVAEHYDSGLVKELLLNKGFDPTRLPSIRVVNPSQLDTGIEAQRIVIPDYEEELQLKYGDFTAKILILLSPEGKVFFPKILKNPAKELAKPILESINHWQFQPITAENQPAWVKVVIPLRFEPTPKAQKFYELPQLHKAPKIKKSPTPNSKLAGKFKTNRRNVVKVEFSVDKTGHVVDSKILSTSDPELNELMKDHSMKFVFEPAEIDGNPVNCKVVVPILL